VFFSLFFRGGSEREGERKDRYIRPKRGSSFSFDRKERIREPTFEGGEVKTF